MAHALHPLRPATGLVAAALALLLLVGCETDGPDTVELRTVALGEPFEIAEGATVRVGEDGPALLFESVAADSRCLENAQCIDAGEARVRLILEPEAADPQDATLAIPGLTPAPYAEAADTPLGDYRVRLLGLETNPGAEAGSEEGGATGPTALLVVERND